MTPPPVPAETPGETPVEMLRRAAAKVREVGEKATAELDRATGVAQEINRSINANVRSMRTARLVGGAS